MSAGIIRQDTDTATATGADAELVYAQVTDRSHVLGSVVCGYASAPAATGLLTIDWDENIVFQIPIGGATPQAFTFDPPLAAPRGEPLTVKLSSKTGIAGYVNASHWLE